MTIASTSTLSTRTPSTSTSSSSTLSTSKFSTNTLSTGTSGSKNSLSSPTNESVENQLGKILMRWCKQKEPKVKVKKTLVASSAEIVTSENFVAKLANTAAENVVKIPKKKGWKENSEDYANKFDENPDNPEPLSAKFTSECSNISEKYKRSVKTCNFQNSNKVRQNTSLRSDTSDEEKNACFESDTSDDFW